MNPQREHDGGRASVPLDGELRWASDSARSRLGYASSVDALLDPRGWTVRCTPYRRTLVLVCGDGSRVFAKHRTRRPLDAVVEWQALETLRDLDLDAPEPVFLARGGRRTVLGIAEVAGRPADAVLRDALLRGDAAAAESFVATRLAPAVRRLHAAGYCYRDLYLNHLFVVDLESSPSFIDAERLFRPPDMGRWIVKDLAGLLASWPDPDPPTELLLDAVGATEQRAAIEAKALRIRDHRPKYR